MFAWWQILMRNRFCQQWFINFLKTVIILESNNILLSHSLVYESEAALLFVGSPSWFRGTRNLVGRFDEASKRAKRSAVVKGWGRLFIHRPRSALPKAFHETDILGIVKALIRAYLYIGKSTFMLNHAELIEFRSWSNLWYQVFLSNIVPIFHGSIVSGESSLTNWLLFYRSTHRQFS